MIAEAKGAKAWWCETGAGGRESRMGYEDGRAKSEC